MWLVIGAYLIAGAVKDSGLGERLAYGFIKRFVRSYTGIILSVFAASVPVSLIFLTGDSVINPLAASYAGKGMADSWLGWF